MSIRIFRDYGKSSSMSTQMPDIITEKLVLEETRRFARHHLAEHPSDQLITQVRFQHLWRAFSNSGLHSIGWQALQSEQGIPHLMQWEIIRILSTFNPGVALSYLAQNILVTHPLTRYSHTPWHNTVLHALTGGGIASCAISEPGAGSDIMAMTTTATKTPTGYRLDGQKCWITNAPYADYVLVYAKIDRKDSRDLGVFIIPTNLDGITQSSPLKKIGMHPSPTGSLLFSGVMIPEHTRLDSPKHSGKSILFSQLDYERVMLSAGPVGIMDWCLSTTKTTLQTRQQFGKALCEFQLMQALYSDMYTARQSSCAYAHSLLNHHSISTLSATDAASLYLFCSEQCLQATNSTIQSLGGMGYMQECLAGQYHHDAKLFTIGGGTSEIKRWLIGRSLLCR